MGQNIFTYENVSPYHVGTASVCIGEWVQRNGVWAMQMRPTSFYASGTYSHILANEFIPNTRYIFNIYMDTDDHYHNEKYTSAGLYIGYSDGTESNAIYGTQSTTPRGWQTKRFITPANKSVAYIRMGYNYNEPSYYRWDSYIVLYDVEHIYKKGQTYTSQLIEDAPTCSFYEGGNVHTNQLYEY